MLLLSLTGGALGGLLDLLRCPGGVVPGNIRVAGVTDHKLGSLLRSKCEWVCQINCNSGSASFALSSEHHCKTLGLVIVLPDKKLRNGQTRCVVQKPKSDFAECNNVPAR